MTDARKTVLITGCTPGGIGHALALEFHAQGARVFASARRVETLGALRDKGIETLPIDVTSDESVGATVVRVQELTGGKLDILLNNAGRGYTMAALDADLAQVEAVFATNVVGTMRMVKAFAPLVIAARGRIVIQGSIGGTTPMPFRTAYSASKAALHAFGDGLRLEMKPLDVQVTTLITGAVRSVAAGEDRVAAIYPDSLYASVLPTVNKVTGETGPKQSMPLEQYAKEVVTTLLKEHAPKWFWVGAAAAPVWFLSNFVPRFISDSAISGMWGLKDLTQARKAK